MRSLDSGSLNYVCPVCIPSMVKMLVMDAGEDVLYWKGKKGWFQEDVLAGMLTLRQSSQGTSISTDLVLHMRL